MKFNINQPLPEIIRLPLQLREPGQAFEGSVQHPVEALGMFEPVDTLNGALELVDEAGNIITLYSEDATVLEKNEYPKEYDGIYYEVKEA